MRKVLRSLTVIGLMMVGLFALVLPASAHVKVKPFENIPTVGSYPEIYFTMPNEETTNTVKLQVSFPADEPFSFVRITQPPLGWSYTYTMGKPAKPVKDFAGNLMPEVVTGITWTATTSPLKPIEYANFFVRIGPLPDAKSVEFKAIQTYANGDVVRWIEDPAAAGAAEPEHPAPTLDISPAAATTTSAAPTTSAQASVTATSMGDMAGMNMAGSSKSANNTLPVILASVAIAIGLIALLIAISRRRTSSHTT